MASYQFNLGSYRRLVTTKSCEARLWFERDLAWAYIFNHEEAGICFAKATQNYLDCAMGYWGLAYARGPDYNKVRIRFDPVDLETIFRDMRLALQRAQDLIPKATPVEAALIEAFVAMYPQSGTLEDLRTLDLPYAEAMRPVYALYPNDLDVAGLFVEALMCLSLRALHLLHMPTHTYDACGDYRSVVDFSHNAILVNNKYFAHKRAAGETGLVLYQIYRVHNMKVMI